MNVGVLISGMAEAIAEWSRMASEVREHPLRTLVPEVLAARSLHAGNPADHRLSADR